MAEKTLNNIRIVNKHDTEANWLKATGFIPKQGELIVYDKDSTYNYERFKIGDGSTVVSSLPFADANKVDKVSGKGLSTNDYTTTEKNKLAGIAEGANKTVVDTAMSSTSTNPVQNKVVNAAIGAVSDLIGGKKVSEQISEAIAAKVDKVDGKGLSTNDYTTTEKNKLSGIASGAEVNQNAFSNITVGSTTIAADAKTDTLTLVAGDNITLTPDATNDKITIAATDTKYTHPSYTARTGVPTANATPAFGGTFNVSQPVSDATGHITAINSRTITIPNSTATTSAAGLMSAADKTTLDALDSYVGDKKVSVAIDEAFDKAITGMSVSGKVITYTKGDGTTGTITTQDTNTTYSAMTGATASAAGAAGLVPAPAAGKNTSFLRGDGTWVVPTNTTYNAATTSAAGLMSAADKTKLDGIETGANAYVHPSYTARTGVPTGNQSPAFGGTFTVTQPASDATGHITSMTSRTITIPSATATTSAAGLMSAADKTTLNKLSTYVGDKSVSEQIESAISTAAVTWDKVSGKPFNDGDIAIDWDGDTTGKTYVATNGEVYYKVSNYIFKTCDFTNDNAYLAVIDSALNTPITERIPLSNVVEEDGVLVIGSYNIISTPYNSMELYINGSFVTFPTAGTYFRYIPEAFYISSLYVQQASGKIYSQNLPQGVASKAELAQQARNSTWTQIYNSGATTKNVNAFSNIDISGYTKIKVAIKCVNVTASAGTTAGAVIFTDEFGNNFSFSSLFGNLITNTAGTAAAMAEFTIVDGFIICDNALRSTSAANMLSNTDGQGAWGLTSVGGGLIACSSTIASMKIAATNLSTTHYYGAGSKVIVWGCKA